MTLKTEIVKDKSMENFSVLATATKVLAIFARAWIFQKKLHQLRSNVTRISTNNMERTRVYFYQNLSQCKTAEPLKRNGY